MTHSELYHFLKEKINYSDDNILLNEQFEVSNFTFRSLNSEILPGELKYQCPQHNFEIENCQSHDQGEEIRSMLDVKDSKVLENKQFRYHIFHPSDKSKCSEVIILLHGFNEKNWLKYFPWAYRLMEITGNSVLLFPIAFHMNRSPQEWTNRQFMAGVSEERKKMFPEIIGTSLINAAISTRLHTKPQRFIWSGMQTYYDVIQLIEQIRQDRHPHFSPDCKINLFAYSIGGLLAQTLLMTNFRNYFDESKCCLFCSGSVFNRITPVCKFIMDSETEQTLYRYVVGHLQYHLKTDHWLGHFLSENHIEGMNFLSLLNYNYLTQHRESQFRKIQKNLYAITLQNDHIIPPYEIVNTLQGRSRDIPIPVEIEDLPYEYRHEDPFPLHRDIISKSDESFERIMGRMGRFYL